MLISRQEQITWHTSDYIYEECYSYDRQRISKGDIEKLVDYYFKFVNSFDEYISIDEYTDWIHELEDEDITMILYVMK